MQLAEGIGAGLAQWEVVLMKADTVPRKSTEFS